MTTDPRPIHISHLKAMALSPAHYRYLVDHGREDTIGLRIGRLTHTLVLGGPKFAVWPGTRRGKEWELFASEHAGQEIATESEYAKARAMADSVLAHPLSDVLLAGEHEKHIEWQYLGRSFSSRLDVLSGDSLSDLKTTVTAHPDRFMWQAIRLGYLAQMRAYQMAAGLLIGAPSRVLAVESAPPHVCTAFRLTLRALEQGEKALRLWTEQLLACEASNVWPGYTNAICDLDVPEESPMLTYGDTYED